MILIGVSQTKAGTQGTLGNSSAPSAIVESQWEEQVPPNSQHLGWHTGDHHLPSSARLLPLGGHFHWGLKTVALSQLPFLLLLKPYTAMTAHTSPQVPVRSQFCGLCLLKCQVSPMGSGLGAASFLQSSLFRDLSG